jgi:hypothetical protein
MELKKRNSLVNMFKKTFNLIKSKDLNHESLLSKGRFSYNKLTHSELWTDSINYNISISSILSDPITYQLLRELKFTIEKFDHPLMSMKQVETKYASVIAEIKLLGNQISSTVDLSRADDRLYRRICKIPHWPLIKYLTLTDSTGDFFYWCDDDLINKAGDYENFTHLKYAACGLHRHIMGRELKSKVELRWSHYITFARIGLGDKIYRSLGELVFGNMIVLAGTQDDFIWQYDTGLCRKDSNKPMISDFYCKSLDLLIEISMFIENGRGSRGESYDARRQEKLSIFQNENKKSLFIDSSIYYHQGCFFASGFADKIIQELNKHGYTHLNDVANETEDKLGFFTSAETMFELNSEEYLDFLEKEFGLIKMAQLSTSKSFLRQVIKVRPDADDIFKLLKKKGYGQRKTRGVGRKK